MTQKEFAMWQAITKSSQFHWTEDAIYRLNGRGTFYYHGGEDGIYIRIQNNGKLEAGNYEGAIPHIGEAFFKPVVQRQCKDYNEAYTLAMEAGGKQFLIDMLTQPDIITPDEPDEKAYENYQYKPLNTVTVGSTDIEIAEDKDAAPGKRYAVYEREDLGMTEQFHRMVHTDDFSEAVKTFANMVQNQINGFQTAIRQAAEPQDASSVKEPIRINFYCPLTVKIDDPDECEYTEADNSYIAYHEDKFRDFLEADLQRGGGTDLAEYFHGSPDLQEKLTSVRFDVENVREVIYGCIHCETTEPVTPEEIDELRDYCTGQASDGFGEGLEQQPFHTPDGDLYVSFWDSDADWFMLEDDEFWSKIESDQQMGGMQ